MRRLAAALFWENSEIAARIRSLDWSQLSLGSVESWPSGLKTCLSILFNANCPMFLVWGRDRLLFYNDAYAALLPQDMALLLLGKPLSACWEHGVKLRADIEQVFETGQSYQRQHEWSFRHQSGQSSAPGYSSAQCYTWSYSAIWEETYIGGVFASGCSVDAPTVALLDPDGTFLEQDKLDLNQLDLNQLDLDRDRQSDQDEPGNQNKPGNQDTPGNQNEQQQADRQQIEASLRQSQSQLEAELSAMSRLQDLSARLFVAPDLTSALRTILNAAIVILNADMGTMQLYNPQNKTLELFAHQGFEQEFLDYFAVVHGAGAACGSAMYSRQRVIIEDVLTDPGFEPHRPIAARAGYRAVQSTPLISRSGELLGMLSTHFRQPHCPSQRELRILDLYARQAVDLIERIRAEEALQESEQRFRNMADNAPVMIWQTDATGACTYLSQSWYDFSGQTEATGLGLGWLDVVHPEDREYTKTTFLAANKRQESFRLEYRLRRADGEWCWAIDAASPWFGVDGQFKGYVGSVMDITDRKRAEAALRQSEERLRLAQQAAGAGLWDWDITTNCVTWSEEYYTLYGIDPAITPSYDHWIASIWEADRDRVDQTAHQALEHYRNLNVEFRVFHPTRGMRWLAAIGQTLYDTTGQPQRMTGIALDITDRKRAEAALSESEERFRDLADNIAQLAWMADNTGSLFWYNRRWFDYTGTTLEEMVGWGWQEVHHPDHLDRVVEKFRHCIEAGEIWEDTFPIRRHDGEYGWFLSRAIPLQDEQGKICRWFGTNTDITDRLQAEQERERLLERAQAAREEAETANRIKDEFLAVLSHELRSPLNPILGWVKLLQTQRLDAQKTKQALETIERNARLQTQLIEDLLDVSRILRGKLALTPVPVNLVTVIEAALETVRLAAEAKGIRIQTLLDASVSQVMGDAARLQQVIWNLLSNAIKFTPAGGSINIQLEQVQDAVQIQVIDTGKGINPVFLPYVFEYFRQEDGSTTRRFGGLGLGLAIVRHLTELHGGSVEADSLGEGLGATFTVTLPLLRKQCDRTATTNPDYKSWQASPLHPLAGLQILVVDDEPDIREIVAFILEQAGATVSIATSASEALLQLEQGMEQGKFNVLVCDIGMPDIDGYMLMRQIRTLLPHQGGKIPAIALTAYAGEGNQQQALAAGFQLHLAKPIDPENLIAAIVTLVAAN